jgi:hypothetical protein
VANGRGRGPGGPEAHREPTGEVTLAGGWSAVKNLAGEELRFRRGIRDGGGDSGHHGSIRLAGRKRTTLGIFSASRRSKGERGTAALGGELRLL